MGLVAVWRGIRVHGEQGQGKEHPTGVRAGVGEES